MTTVSRIVVTLGLTGATGAAPRTGALAQTGSSLAPVAGRQGRSAPTQGGS
jgi:hypothetical protein